MSENRLARAGDAVPLELQKALERVQEHDRQKKQREEAQDARGKDRRQRRKGERPLKSFLKGNVEARVWRNGKEDDRYLTVDLVRYYSRFDDQEEAWSFRYDDLHYAVRALLKAKSYVRREEKRFGKRRGWWE
jgi:hypothetical protein